MKLAKTISIAAITGSIFVGPPALAWFLSPTKTALPADAIPKFQTAHKPTERLEIRPATTNVVVVPAGTNFTVAASATHLSVSLTPPKNGSTTSNTLTAPVRIPRDSVFNFAPFSTDIPAGTNSIVVASGSTNAVPLSPGTNIVIVPAVTNLLSTAEAVGQTNLLAYFQIQSEDETRSEFGLAFSQAFYVGEVTVQNTNDFTVLAYSASLQVDVKYFLLASQRKHLPDSQLAQIHEGAFLPGQRRPATFSDILAIFDYQQKKNWKQRTVDVIKSAGQVAAGVTVFVGGATYPKAVSLVTGIISPEIEKHLLWDLLLHAKNLESRSFKEIEEIPAYKPITKLVFFPKGGIPGLMPNLLVHLGGFQEGPQDVRMQGALLKEQQSIKSVPLNQP